MCVAHGGLMLRERLPNRRSAETWDLEALGLKFRATIGTHPNGKLGEMFLSNHRVNSMAGIMASDAAVLCSLLLQYGVPVDVIRKSRHESVLLSGGKVRQR